MPLLKNAENLVHKVCVQIGERERESERRGEREIYREREREREKDRKLGRHHPSCVLASMLGCDTCMCLELDEQTGLLYNYRVCYTVTWGRMLEPILST